MPNTYLVQLIVNKDKENER